MHKPMRLWAVILWAVLGFSSCGKNGPPIPPPPTFEDQQAFAVDPAVGRLIDRRLQVTTQKQKDAQAWISLGIAFQANEFFDQALKSYEYAALLDPSDPRSHFYLATVHTSLGQLEQAAEQFGVAAELDSSYVPTHWRRGFAQLRLGDFAAAEGSFRTSVDMGSQQIVGRVGLARVALARNEGQAAVDHLEQILDRDPQQNYARFLVAAAYRQLGRLDDAAAALVSGNGQISKGQVPQWRDPWSDEIDRARAGFGSELDRARADLHSGNVEAAIGRLEKLHEERPEEISAIINLGAAYVGSGRHEEALAILEPAYANNRSRFNLVMNLAAAQFMAQDFDQALRYAEEAIAIDPRKSKPYEMKGAVLQSRGQLEPAVKALRGAVRHDPSSLSAWLRLAQSQEALRRWKVAHISYSRAAQLAPERGDIQLSLGRASAVLGDYAAAREAFEKAQRLGVPNEQELQALLDRLAKESGGDEG